MLPLHGDGSLARVSEGHHVFNDRCTSTFSLTGSTKLVRKFFKHAKVFATFHAPASRDHDARSGEVRTLRGAHGLADKF